MSAEELYERLKAVDPIAAAEIHPNNKKRISRAIEIAVLGGSVKSNTAKHTLSAPRYPHALIVLSAERGFLYERINQRVDTMLKNGLMQEVESLYKCGAGKNSQSMQAIGYKQLIEVIEGRAEINEAVEKIKQLSRNYAKRQLTWFKKMREAKWISIDKSTDVLSELIKI